MCGRVFFPKRTVCFDCKHLDTSTMEEVHLSLKGKLHTGLFVHAAPEGFKTPYAIGFIDLPEGVRVFSQLVGENLSDEVLTAGREAEMIIEKIREDEAGNDVVAYKFKVI
ncbi:MAG: OB-fold domain-containing protein [Dehalococcoidia bacterium]|nr:OB-fold domain-containing protein [Dehalococcoidia bacterium]